MTNLCTDKMVFFCNLTKIETDENKAIYSSTPISYSPKEKSYSNNMNNLGTFWWLKLIELVNGIFV